jgi:hypothetical protein
MHTQIISYPNRMRERGRLDRDRRSQNFWMPKEFARHVDGPRDVAAAISSREECNPLVSLCNSTATPNRSSAALQPRGEHQRRAGRGERLIYRLHSRD